MKKKLLFVSLLLFLSWAVNSCEALTDCGICQNVQYEDGIQIYAGPEEEYCGEELIRKKATAPITIGSVTTKVECR